MFVLTLYPPPPPATAGPTALLVTGIRPVRPGRRAPRPPPASSSWITQYHHTTMPAKRRRGPWPGRATSAGPALVLEGEEKRDRGREEGGGGRMKEGWRRGEGDGCSCDEHLQTSDRACAINELVADYFVVFTLPSSNTPLYLIHFLLKLTLMKMSTSSNQNSAI